MHSLKKTRLITSAGAILALTIIATPVLLSHQKAVAQTAVSKTPLVALSGSNSRIVKASFKRITSATEWEALWKQHTGKPVSNYYDKSEMPRVNFDDCMVIAVFSGPSVANDGVSAVSVTEQPEKVVLRYSNRYLQITVPDVKAREKAVVNGAFGMFVLPRSAKPVVLEESVRTLKGETPVAKVRAELPVP